MQLTRDKKNDKKNYTSSIVLDVVLGGGRQVRRISHLPLVNLNFIMKTTLMKKALRETKTLRAGCSKAEPKIFAPPQTPSRGRGTAKI